MANTKAGVEQPDDVDIHTRVLHLPLGPWRIALILTIGAFWIVVPNMPRSAVRDDLQRLWGPAEQVGLVQDWAVFSPNPRSQSIDVRARIEFDDGSIDFWDVPDFDPILGALRKYRWHKWQERIRLDNRERLWNPTAEWIADQHLRNGVRPLQVTLIRRWIDHQPLTPGEATEVAGWNEFEFFVWKRDA